LPPDTRAQWFTPSTDSVAFDLLLWIDDAFVQLDSAQKSNHHHHCSPNHHHPRQWRNRSRSVCAIHHQPDDLYPTWQRNDLLFDSVSVLWQVSTGQHERKGPRVWYKCQVLIA
jgi:hypothetical protein